MKITICTEHSIISKNNLSKVGKKQYRYTKYATLFFNNLTHILTLRLNVKQKNMHSLIK